MASKNTRRRNREARLQELRSEENLIRVMRQAREQLWLDVVNIKSERIAHVKACREEMERVNGLQ